MDAIKVANLGLAFLLELCALAAFAFWGYQTGQGIPMKIGLAIGAPLLVAVLWGLFEAPRATFPLPQPWRTLFALVVFGCAAAALYTTGQNTLAWVFAVAVALNQVLLSVWKQQVPAMRT
jgi:hypothetical protein